jgi:hypothetical protein
MTAAGDGSADIGVGELNDFLRRCAEQFFQEIGAARNTEFLGEDAERVFGGDKMDAGDAGVGVESAECFAGQDGAGCAGDGEG